MREGERGKWEEKKKKKKKSQATATIRLYLLNTTLL